MKKEFDFRFLNKVMYVSAFIALFYIFKNLGIVDKFLEINKALIPVYLGIATCFICMPISRRLRKIGVGKNLSAILSLVAFYSILAIIVAIIVPMFVSQIGELITNFPNIYTNVKN